MRRAALSTLSLLVLAACAVAVWAECGRSREGDDLDVVYGLVAEQPDGGWYVTHFDAGVVGP